MEIQKFQLPGNNVTVFDTSLVEVFVPQAPHTHAPYGGHLVIQTKSFRSTRSQFTAAERHEVAILEQACETLMMERLGAQFTNLQDNGNWFFWNTPMHPKEKAHICTCTFMGEARNQSISRGAKR